jgi:hypothetical protein
MLGEVASGTMDALAVAPELRVRQMAVTLPVEFAISRRAGQIDLLGDLPRSITRTAFDIQPSRIVMVWEMRNQA